MVRGAAKGTEAFATYDKANGEHTRCFFPNATAPVGLCEFSDGIDGATLINGSWSRLPKHDPRCSAWGDADTLEYITCEAAMPQTLAGAEPKK